MTISSLIFRVGEDRFAIDCASVVILIPLVELRPIHRSPPHIAGLFTYHGRIVPVIDVNTLIIDRPCEKKLSTRIIMVQLPPLADAPGSESDLIGLMAEDATRIEEIDPKKGSTHPGFKIQDAPYLGIIAQDDRGMIQFLRPAHILTDEQRKVLFNRDA